MLVYPQLASGALSQFPVVRRRRTRTVVNRAPDDSTFKLADSTGAVTEWRLEYSDLTDGELAALEQFFAAAEGSLNGFTFLDPLSNLLAWSNDLTNTVWLVDPELTVATNGNTWRIVNNGAGPQSIRQTLAVPGAYTYCLSVFLAQASGLPVTLLIGPHRSLQTITPNFSRIVFTSTGGDSSDSVTFGIELPAAASVDVYGFQAEVQPVPSVWQSTTTGGVYENARISSDELLITTTAPNHHSCTVSIIHANHL